MVNLSHELYANIEYLRMDKWRSLGYGLCVVCDCLIIVVKTTPLVYLLNSLSLVNNFPFGIIVCVQMVVIYGPTCQDAIHYQNNCNCNHRFAYVQMYMTTKYVFDEKYFIYRVQLVITFDLSFATTRNLVKMSLMTKKQSQMTIFLVMNVHY